MCLSTDRDVDIQHQYPLPPRSLPLHNNGVDSFVSSISFISAKSGPREATGMRSDVTTTRVELMASTCIIARDTLLAGFMS